MTIKKNTLIYFAILTAVTGFFNPSAYAGTDANSQGITNTVVKDDCDESEVVTQDTKTIVGKDIAKKDVKDPKTNKNPIIVEGKDLYYNDATGAVYATGDVVIIQDPSKITSQIVKGNTKTSDLWFEGSAVFTQPGLNLTGTDGFYNYKNRNGTMQQAKGKADKEFISGKDIQIYPDKLILEDGSMTRCPAIVPDYRVTGDKIELWPGDKMIAYNAKLWFQNTVIYTMPKYVRDLKQTQSDFPRIGYDNHDGFYIKQYLAYPIANHVSAYADIGYYSKSNIKNQYGIIDRENAYTLQVMQGKVKDSDDNWVKKEPEFRLDLAPKKVGTLPVTYIFSAVYGKWNEGTVQSWHQDYNVYFSRDAINLGKDLNLYVGTGYEMTHESYNKSSNNTFKYDVSLYKNWAKWGTWTAYHYTQNNSSLFAYDKVDMSKEGDIGFSYSPSKKNTFSYSMSYDMENKRVYDRDYSWRHDLHCWQTTITYRAERKEWKWDIAMTRW